MPNSLNQGTPLKLISASLVRVRLALRLLANILAHLLRSCLSNQAGWPTTQKPNRCTKVTILECIPSNRISTAYATLVALQTTGQGIADLLMALILRNEPGFLTAAGRSVATILTRTIFERNRLLGSGPMNMKT